MPYTQTSRTSSQASPTDRSNNITTMDMSTDTKTDSMSNARSSQTDPNIDLFNPASSQTEEFNRPRKSRHAILQQQMRATDDKMFHNAEILLEKFKRIGCKMEKSKEHNRKGKRKYERMSSLSNLTSIAWLLFGVFQTLNRDSTIEQVVHQACMYLQRGRPLLDEELPEGVEGCLRYFDFWQSSFTDVDEGRHGELATE